MPLDLAKHRLHNQRLVGPKLAGPAVVTAVCAPLAMALYRRER